MENLMEFKPPRQLDLFDFSVSMYCPEKGVYHVEHRGQLWVFDNFADANKKMTSLCRPASGDPK